MVASTTHTHGVHFLFTDGLFHIDPFAFDLMTAFENGFIYRVVIIEFDETETARFPRILFGEPGNGFNFSKLFEILADVIFGHILFEATDKDLLDCLACFRLSKFLSRRGPLGFNRFPIDCVRSCILASVDFLVRGERDKTEPSGPAAAGFEPFSMDFQHFLRKASRLFLQQHPARMDCRW